MPSVRSHLVLGNSLRPTVSLKPASDVRLGSWSAVGGATAAGVLADNLDSTFIEANAALGTSFGVNVQPETDPQTTSGFTIRIRGYSQSYSSMTLELYAGGNLVTTRTVSFDAQRTTYDFEVSAADMAAVNSADFYGGLQFYGTAV